MSERFRDNDDQTVTDTETGLTWTVDCYGKGSQDQLEAGATVGFSWFEAVDRFGKGRKYRAWGFDPSDGGANRIQSDAYAKYVFGRDVVTIAGHEDWRLPTVEEFWSLIEEMENPQYPRPDARIACALLMPETEVFWTANKYGFLNQMDCSWLFNATSYSGGTTRMQCDAPPSGTARVVFVRGGMKFQATAFPSSAHKRRNKARVVTHMRISPSLLRDPVGWMTASFCVDDENVFIDRRVLSFIPIGDRPSVPINSITRMRARGTFWGDVVFGTDASEVVTWSNVYRPERVRKRAKDIIDRIRGQLPRA